MFVGFSGAERQFPTDGERKVRSLPTRDNQERALRRLKIQLNLSLNIVG